MAQGPNLILLACTRISTAGQPIKPGTTEFEEDPDNQLRIRLEPEATASVAGRLSEADFARLESKMKVYDHPPSTIEEERQQRVAELEFHELLVGYCPNPLMTFACRFLISLLEESDNLSPDLWHSKP